MDCKNRIDRGIMKRKKGIWNNYEGGLRIAVQRFCQQNRIDEETFRFLSIYQWEDVYRKVIENFVDKSRGYQAGLHWLNTNGVFRDGKEIQPVFDTRPIVTFGTDNIYTHDCLDPYRGFGWVTLPDWCCGDTERIYKSYTEKFLPGFEKLKASISNAVLPELNEMCSLDQFIATFQVNDLLFEKESSPIPVQDYILILSPVSDTAMEWST